jgi:hypothetical protein
MNIVKFSLLSSREAILRLQKACDFLATSTLFVADRVPAATAESPSRSQFSPKNIPLSVWQLFVNSFLSAS